MENFFSLLILRFVFFFNFQKSNPEEDPFVPTSEDLAGFWDMVYIQVEHIHSLFAELSTLRQNGWKRPEVRYLFLSFDMVDDQNTSCTYHINQNQINLENCNICFNKVKHNETFHTKTAKTNKKKLS